VPSLPLGAAALGGIALGLGVVAIWASPTGLLVGAVILAIGVAFSTPAFFTAIFATASPSQRGVASGTASAALDLGLGLGPILLGLIAEPFGLAAAFGAGAAVAGAGAGWTLALRARSRPRAASAERTRSRRACRPRRRSGLR
jgi:MFS family permease